MLAYTGTSLLFLAPLLVSLALKVNDLVGIDAAPSRLALVTSVGSLLAMVANPFFGRLSDRSFSGWGMRRPWMVVGVAVGSLGILMVALAPNITVVVLGWCTAQVFFNALLAQSAALVVSALVAGKLSDRTGHRKVFVLIAAIVYGLGLFVVAGAHDVHGYLVGMALGGLGFGMYVAVDVALVVDVLPDPDQAAKDLGVLNIAGALPFSLAPAIAPVILALGGGSYRVLFTVAGVCAVAGAAAILPVKGVR
jgi:MFS family permease